jgi:hypothetical protein
MTKKLSSFTKTERSIGRKISKTERQVYSLGKGIINHKRFNRFLRVLGLGLVTGAADDDPSGIATYSQAVYPEHFSDILFILSARYFIDSTRLFRSSYRERNLR